MGHLVLLTNLPQDKRSATVFEKSTSVSDIPVANGLTVDGDGGLSWRLHIRLRTIRGERVDLYEVHLATLQSALEGMAPNERATWNGRPSGGRLGEVLGMFKTIAESDCEWQWARARAMLAAHIKYNIDHSTIHEALLDLRLGAFNKHNMVKEYSNNNSVGYVSVPMVERYIRRAAGVLGNFDARRDQKIVPQIRFIQKNISLLLGNSEVGWEMFNHAFRQQLQRKVRSHLDTSDLGAQLRSADDYVLPTIACILQEFPDDEKTVKWIR